MGSVCFGYAFASGDNAAAYVQALLAAAGPGRTAISFWNALSAENGLKRRTCDGEGGRDRRAPKEEKKAEWIACGGQRAAGEVDRGVDLKMNTIQINRGNVKMIAHRGLSGLEAENSHAAFVAAGNRSYYGIETDLHVTADGRFVLMHDDNTKRVSGVDKIVRAMYI